MSDVEDIIVAEVGTDPIETNNKIEDLLKSIETGDYNNAEKGFNDLLQDRLADELEVAKARVAASIYNSELDIHNDEEEEFDQEEEALPRGDPVGEAPLRPLPERRVERRAHGGRGPEPLLDPGLGASLPHHDPRRSDHGEDRGQRRDAGDLFHRSGR